MSNQVIKGYWVADNNTKVKVKDTIYNLCHDSLNGDGYQFIYMDNGQTLEILDNGMFQIINTKIKTQ